MVLSKKRARHVIEEIIALSMPSQVWIFVIILELLVVGYVSAQTTDAGC